MTCEWRSDTELVVLEVPQTGTKSSTDSDRTCWRNLLHELETEAEIVDCAVNSHELKRMNRDDGDILRQSFGGTNISLSSRRLCVVGNSTDE